MNRRQARDSSGPLGWKCYTTDLPPKAVKHRLETCPLDTVREAMRVITRPFRGSGPTPRIRYKRGLAGQDEIACGRWILYSKIPDQNKLSTENEEQIFDWIRETL